MKEKSSAEVVRSGIRECHHQGPAGPTAPADARRRRIVHVRLKQRRLRSFTKPAHSGRKAGVGWPDEQPSTSPSRCVAGASVRRSFVRRPRRGDRHLGVSRLLAVPWQWAVCRRGARGDVGGHGPRAAGSRVPGARLSPWRSRRKVASHRAPRTLTFALTALCGRAYTRSVRAVLISALSDGRDERWS